MRVRPGLTIEGVFKLHENIERDHPPGSEQRGAVLEQFHRLLTSYAAFMRQLRQLPDDDGHYAKLKPLAKMAILDAQTIGQKSFRALARKVLGGRADDGSVERLARKYSQHLRDYPGLPGRRFDGLLREIRREYAVRTAVENALALAREDFTKG